MSDYLTRLSARALGIAAAVRPAIPPMFALAPVTAPTGNGAERVGRNAPGGPEPEEDASGAASVAPRGHGVSTAGSIEAAASRTEVPSARVDSASDPVHAATPPESDDARPPPPRPGADGPPPPSARDSRRERDADAVEASAADSRAGLAAAATRRKPSALAGAPAPSVVANAADAPAGVPAMRTGLRAPAPRPEDGEAGGSTPNRSVAGAQSSFPRDAAADVSRVLEPLRARPSAAPAEAVHDDLLPPRALDPGVQLQFARLRAFGEGARRTRAAVGPGAEAPVVRVSIGRIEVRAVGAPAPAAPAGPRAPVRPSVTLARYLARNRGGRT